MAFSVKRKKAMFRLAANNLDLRSVARGSRDSEGPLVVHFNVPVLLPGVRRVIRPATSPR
jgi:hypothetical protein